MARGEVGGSPVATRSRAAFTRFAGRRWIESTGPLPRNEKECQQKLSPLYLVPL